MSRLILLLVVASLTTFFISCNKEKDNKDPLTGVWKEAGIYNIFTTQWDIASCESDDTHEFTTSGGYNFNPGTDDCGTQTTKSMSYTKNNDTIIINNTTMWVIDELSDNELIYLHRASFGTGFVWVKRRLTR